MIKKYNRRLIITTLASLLLSGTVGQSAHAFSGSDSVTMPNTKVKLQANAWSPNFIYGGKVDFATSSKTTLNGNVAYSSTIKNTATVEARGISASISLSGPNVTGSKSSKSISWTNNNSWISDLSGRASYGGVTFSVHVNSAAFTVYKGSVKYVDVWSW